MLFIRDATRAMARVRLRERSRRVPRCPRCGVDPRPDRSEHAAAGRDVCVALRRTLRRTREIAVVRCMPRSLYGIAGGYVSLLVYTRHVTRLSLLVVLGCSEPMAPELDAPPGPATLEVALVSSVNSRIEGAGILCGVAASCDGTWTDICRVTPERGTHIKLTVVHPVCPPNANYFAFHFSPPEVCTTRTNWTCELDFTTSVRLTVTGIIAVR